MIKRNQYKNTKYQKLKILYFIVKLICFDEFGLHSKNQLNSFAISLHRNKSLLSKYSIVLLIILDQ